MGYNGNVFAGLLANLTCIQAELYEMEKALSVREDPLWIVPYSTIADDYTGLMEDFELYALVRLQLKAVSTRGQLHMPENGCRFGVIRTKWYIFLETLPLV